MTRWNEWLIGGALLLCCGGSLAANDELVGTLKKVRESRSITLGYRAASLPFSYLGPHGEPIGYSIELCRDIVDAISDDLGVDVAIHWVPVMAADRLDAVSSGQVDLECGSTTSNLERKKRVAFSPIIFVSGTKLMVKSGSAIRSFRDLVGKTVVVTAGTTNEKAMRELSAKFRLDLQLVVGKDHDESYRLLTANKAEAFATDEVLLYGLLARNKAQQHYRIVGDFLSYDPYALMFRKNDPQMAELVDRTLRGMAESREIEHAYNQWFMHRLPSGERLNLPMSAQLAELLRTMGERPE